MLWGNERREFDISGVYWPTLQVSKYKGLGLWLAPRYFRRVSATYTLWPRYHISGPPESWHPGGTSIRKKIRRTKPAPTGEKTLAK